MRLFAVSLLISFLTVLPSQGNANQSLNFQTPDNAKQKHIVQTLNKIKSTPKEEYLIAAVDLNGDSLNEYVLRPKNAKYCEQRKFCPHVIMALQDHVPTIIGEFKAYKALISNKTSYGVKHILVYNDLNNDYKSTLAFWDPFSFSFKTQADR